MSSRIQRSIIRLKVIIVMRYLGDEYSETSEETPVLLTSPGTISTFRQVATGKKKIADLEDEILRLLSESTGSLLDDMHLVNTLQDSKTISEEVTQQLQVCFVVDAVVVLVVVGGDGDGGDGGRGSSFR